MFATFSTCNVRSLPFRYNFAKRLFWQVHTLHTFWRLPWAQHPPLVCLNKRNANHAADQYLLHLKKNSLPCLLRPLASTTDVFLFLVPFSANPREACAWESQSISRCEIPRPARLAPSTMPRLKWLICLFFPILKPNYTSASHLHHLDMSKCIDLLPCDWLSGFLCWQVIAR